MLGARLYSTAKATIATLNGSSSQLILADGLCPKIAELLPGALHEVVALGTSASPLTAITEALAQRRLQGQAADTLHVVAHGRPGAFQIGGQWVTAASLIANATQLAQWQVGTIALWSCQVGADREFVALLEELTGSHVFISTDTLGYDENRAASQWSLQSSDLSEQPTPEAFTAEAREAWTHTLAQVTISGLYAATYSYDPSGFFGEETSKVDINKTPVSTTSITFSQSGPKFSGNNVLGTISYVEGGVPKTITAALASRPIKSGGVVKGFYVWIDNPTIGLSNASDKGWVLSFDNAYFAGLPAGQVPITSGQVSSSSDRVDKALNAILGTQQSGVSVTNVTVTEGTDQYAVFSVSNTSGQSRNLNTVNVSFTDLTASAADFTGSTPVIEYFVSGSWTQVKPGAIANGQTILIRVGTILDDGIFEPDEVFELVLNVGNGASQADVSGFGTILNNGADIDPPSVSPQSFSYPENQIAGATIATVVATDNVEVTQFRFTATGTNTSQDGFYQIDNNGNVTITAAGVAAGVAQNDFETSPNSFTYGIQAGDSANNWSASSDISLNVTDIEDTPEPALPVAVSDPEVNENSPFAVFSVTGSAGQSVTLALQNDNDPNTANATLGTDTGTQLQYFDGANWVNYTPGSSIQLPASGELLVRVAINDDSVYEGPETFQLAVTPSGGTTSYGTATIFDDGTGNIYPDNNTGNPDPNAVKDDDRAVQVNNIDVNENSPFGVFTVSGTAGQAVTLALQNDNDPNTANATLGTDTGTQLQYFDGANWVNYTPGSSIQLPASGELLVRVAINDDSVFEGPEVFQLAVTPSGGRTSLGNATILDDGTGNIYPDNNTGNPDPNAVKDDDRAVQVNNIDVNENSPFAVFTVSGTAGQAVTLALQNDNDPNTANATLGTDTGTQLQYFDGANWVNYTPGSSIQLPASGELLVRVAINDDSAFEGPEVFQLAVTPSGGTTSYGNATILDDGTGNIYPDNNTGNPDPNAVKDDDRAVQVNNIDVNENSPFAVFTVSGTAGQAVTLALQNDNDPNTANATLGTDTGTQLQYFDGANWVNYTPGSSIQLPASGELLVRVAINDDSVFEGPEVFQLAVTPSGGTTSYGNATILDDGTGNIYPDNNTGNPDPNAVKDDDRAVQVNNIDVNENSPFAVFTVSGTAGQAVTLALQNDNDPNTANATLGTDTGTQLQYFDGANWVNYTPGSSIQLPASGELLVRVAINDDSAFEGPEVFQLAVTPSGGTTSYGNATILDDGTGNVYPDNNTGNPDPNAVKDDDRAVQVNNIDVNENSPFAVFTVSGSAGQSVTLALQNDNDPNTANATLGTDTGTQLQYFDGANWVNYTPGSSIQLPASGELLVRVAINDDSVYEGPETFQLAVTPSGGTTSYGNATILDDGTGNIYPNNNTGTPDPNAVKDDDRAVQVSNIDVNENSPFAVFTVSGTAGQAVTLALQNDNDPNTANATLGTDTGTQLQYFNGTTWVNYNSGTVNIPSSGQLLVRVAINDDSVFEGPEVFQLAVTPSGGTTSYGNATILDNGTGNIYPNNNTGTPDPNAAKDDDRRPVSLTTGLTMLTGSDSGQVTDLSTANGLPQLQIIGSVGFSSKISLQGVNGETLINGQNYTVREVSLANQPGKAVYVIDLVDADLTKTGKQSFGNYFKGASTGNEANNKDGTYTIFLDGASIGTFEIKTTPLSQAKRINCLNKILSDRALESTLYGYRTEKPVGTNGDDTLLGLASESDTLKGLKGNDLLNGYGDRLTGLSLDPNSQTDQVDILIGGKGKDSFQLGDIAGVFYNQNGGKDYAIIKDFDKFDNIILQGSSSQFDLSATVNGARELYCDGDLVAVIKGRGISGIDLADPGKVSYL